jgi:hypothetical protein
MAADSISQFLICGGSNFGIALDNCVSIQPEGAATWVIERMVCIFSRMLFFLLIGDSLQNV